MLKITNIYSISQPLKNTLANISIQSFHMFCQSIGSTVKWLKQLPKEIGQHPNLPMTVLIITNLIFFKFINQLAIALEERMNNSPKKLDQMDRKFNLFLINGVIVGGAVLSYNVFLSKLIDYPENKITFAAFTIVAIIARWHISSSVSNESSTACPNISKTLHHKNKKVEKGNRLTLQVRKEEIEKTEPLKAQKKFIDRLCDEINLVLQNTFNYVNFSQEQKEAQLIFIKEMRRGIAIIEAQADLCLAVNVSVQAAFEKLLSTLLITGDVTEARVLFLSELPCSSLSTPLQKIDNEKKAEWKKWSVDIRTESVRTLKENCGPITVCYSKIDYQALSTQSPNGQLQFNTYEEEKLKKTTITDLPLPIAIPKELVGALYLFTDSNGNCYILATQSNQIQNHDTTTKECWKMWLGPASDPQINARAQEMMNFVKPYQSLR